MKKDLIKTLCIFQYWLHDNYKTISTSSIDMTNRASEFVQSKGQNLPVQIVSDSTLTKHRSLGWVREVKQYKCPHCLRNQVPELASFCPDCGAKFDWD